MIKNEFLNLYEELSELNEDTTTKLDKEEIKKQINDAIDLYNKIDNENKKQKGIPYETLYAWVKDRATIYANAGHLYVALVTIFNIPADGNRQYATTIKKGCYTLVDMINAHTAEVAFSNKTIEFLLTDEGNESFYVGSFADDSHNTLHSGFGTNASDLSDTLCKGVDLKVTKKTFSELQNNLPRNAHNGDYIILVSLPDSTNNRNNSFIYKAYHKNVKAESINGKGPNVLQIKSGTQENQYKLYMNDTVDNIYAAIESIKDYISVSDHYVAINNATLNSSSDDLIDKLVAYNAALVTSVNKVKSTYHSYKDQTIEDKILKLTQNDLDRLSIDVEKVKDSVDGIKTTVRQIKGATPEVSSKEESLTEKWIEDMNNEFVSKIWYSDSPSEFKAFIQAAAQNKVEGGYRLIVGKDFFCAAKASEMNHDSMCDFIDSNYLTTNLYGSEDTIIGFPKVIDYEQDNFENKDAYEWYLEGNFESNGQVPPEGLSYEEFVSWYDEVLDRFSDGRNSKIIAGKGFEIMLYNYKDIHTLEDFKTKTYIGKALASELVEFKDRSISHITESQDLTEELPDWAVTGNSNGYLGIGLFDMLFGVQPRSGHEPSWVTELRNIFKAYNINFKTNDDYNFVATDASGENIILAFRAIMPRATAYIRFEATSRMKVNQLNPVWEYNAGINGKYSFHGNNYEKIDIDTQNAKELAKKISTYYTNYNKHLENEKLFKEKYIGKTLIDLPITEDNIRFNPGNNGNMFPHFYISGSYSDKYWWNENRHKWYEVLNSQYKVREVDDSEIIK